MNKTEGKLRKVIELKKKVEKNLRKVTENS